MASLQDTTINGYFEHDTWKWETGSVITPVTGAQYPYELNLPSTIQRAKITIYRQASGSAYSQISPTLSHFSDSGRTTSSASASFVSPGNDLTSTGSDVSGYNRQTVITCSFNTIAQVHIAPIRWFPKINGKFQGYEIYTGGAFEMSSILNSGSSALRSYCTLYDSTNGIDLQHLCLGLASDESSFLALVLGCESTMKYQVSYVI